MAQLDTEQDCSSYVSPWWSTVYFNECRLTV